MSAPLKISRALGTLPRTGVRIIESVGARRGARRRADVKVILPVKIIFNIRLNKSVAHVKSSIILFVMRTEDEPQIFKTDPPSL